MRAIITGGTGLLARYIIEELLQYDFEIVAVVSENRMEFAKTLYSNNVRLVSNDFFSDANALKKDIPDSCIINTAFTRANEGKEVARSLDYSYSVFDASKRNGAKSVINCSSRSVYEDPGEGCFNTEESEINTDSLIATAKYGSELLLKAFFNGTEIKYTNLRISSINELKLDNNMIRPLNIFVDCVISGKNLTVYNGNQTMSFVDPRDVARAVRMICCSSTDWKDVYNVGSGELGTYRLIDMAKSVVRIGEEFGFPPMGIDIIRKNINQSAGLNNDRIFNDFGFSPKISLDEMIRSLYEMRISK